MAIPAQLPPQLTLAIRQGALKLLALQSGQTVEAKVLGTAGNGLMQVQIGQQTLTLSLPQPVAVGTLLKLLAQGSGSQQKLVLIQPGGANATATRPASTPQAGLPLPLGSAPIATETAVNVPRSSAPSPARGEIPQAGQGAEARLSAPTANEATRVKINRPTPDTRPSIPPSSGTAPPPQQGQGDGARLTVTTTPTPGPNVTAQGLRTDGSPLPSAGAAPPPAAAGTRTAPKVSGAPASQAGGASSSSPSTPLPASNTPQAALTQMVQTAIGRQDSIASLTPVLAAIAGKVALPQPVLQAMQQVLAVNLPLGPAIGGVALQKAVLSSGIFQEAMLAQGAPEWAKGDLKSNLLSLQKTLVTWLGQTAKAAIVPPGPLPPPVRGALPRSRPVKAGPVALPDSPIEVGKIMLDRTESALARLRLHQHAALLDPTMPSSKADWSMDIPVLIGTYQTAMQLQIQRDESTPDQPAAERGWQIRFAMNLPRLGEVGAQVGLRGGATSVRLWASDPDTAEAFEGAAPQLVQALAAAGLQPGIVIVRAGEPVSDPLAAGHFVDSRT